MDTEGIAEVSELLILIMLYIEAMACEPSDTETLDKLQRIINRRLNR